MTHVIGPVATHLPAVLAPLQADLDLVGACYAEIVKGVSRRTKEMLSQAARFNGKRLRPGLTCIGARMAGGGVNRDVATVAAIVELIHTATLVHDDVLDDAAVRRRVATINVRWGNGVAVLVGDVLFSKAYRAAARLDDRFASRYLSEIVGEILEGEIHQDVVSRNPLIHEKEYRAIIRGKTAVLYEAALVVGAHYGGGTDTVGEHLGRFGHHLGMAFQIIDDRLDLTGDEDVVGKTLGRDLGEGKTTLPIIAWLDARAAEERPDAMALVERAWDDEEAQRELAVRLHRDGALEAADRAAEREIALALDVLDSLPAGEERDLLRGIANYVLRRRR